MRYAKVVNGKIKHVISGLAPDDYIQITKLWSTPTDYPNEFYSKDSNVPRLTVVGGEVHETWGSTIKSVDIIKDEIYEIQRQDRKKAENVPLLFKGENIEIDSEKKKSRISNLAAKNKAFKLGRNKWADYAIQDVKDLQNLLDDTIQAAFDIERASNATVESMTTHDQLKDYLYPL